MPQLRNRGPPIGSKRARKTIGQPKSDPQARDGQGLKSLVCGVAMTILISFTIIGVALVLLRAIDRANQEEKMESLVSAKVSNVGKHAGRWQNELEKGRGIVRMFNDDEIKYVPGGKMYLVIAGFVFDVSQGRKMYDVGTGYHGFIGRDGTRAFVTGNFDDEGLVPDVDGLDDSALLSVSKWIDFYFDAKNYIFAGFHVGHYFDSNGEPTKNMQEFILNVDRANIKKMDDEERDKEFPSCNMEWSASTGTKVWCSPRSGGIDRDWTGVPRKFYENGEKQRCACVPGDLLSDPRIKEYPSCKPNSVECWLKDS